MDQAPLPTERLPLTIRSLARWVDWSDVNNPQIKFTLRLSYNGDHMDFPYSGGILAFIDWKSRQVKFALQENLKSQGHRSGFSRLNEGIEKVRNGSMTRQNTADDQLYKEVVAWIEQHSHPVLSDVANSLVMDTQAGEESFDDFCSDFGYDNDSIKARNIHDLCTSLARGFRALVGADFDEIAKALEDY